MKKPQKTFVKILQGLLIFATLVAMIVLGMFLWNLMKQPKTPIVIQEEQNIYEFTLIDYEVYTPENLLFGFVIAEIDLSSDIALHIGLDVLSTSEGILLSQTDNYLTQLADANLKPGTQSLTFLIESSEKNLSFFIFIPFTNQNMNTLELTSSLNPKSQFSFNLKDSSKQGNLSLILLTNDVSTLEQDLNFKVQYFDLFDKSNFYTLDTYGQPLTIEFGSQDQVYGVSIDITNQSDNTYKLKTAKLVVDNFGIFDLMNPDILLMNRTNLTKTNLVDTVNGFLFFSIPDSKLEILNKTADQLHFKLEFITGEIIEVGITP